MTGGKRPKTGAQARAQRRAPKTAVRQARQGRVPTADSRMVPGRDDQMLRLSMRYADSEHWCLWADPGGAAEVLKFLRDIAGTTWNELRTHRTGNRNGHKKHHSQSFDSVCDTARRRVQDAGHHEIFEELFRFRLSGQKRLWGFERQGTFYILWWDPEHEVYPTERE